MKILLNLVLLLFSVHGMSQPPPTLYFDKDMQPVSKNKALYYGTGEMEDGLFKLQLFYQKVKHQVAYVIYFNDASRKVKTGSMNQFFEDGTPAKKGNYVNGKKDGFWTSYTPTGLVSEQVVYTNGFAEKVTLFHNLPVIRQRVVTVDDMMNNEFYFVLYDEEGKVVTDKKLAQDFSDFAFDPDTTATFQGGPEDWEKYFSRAVKTQSRKLEKKNFGTVLMRFVVDAEGKVGTIKALSMPESKLAEVALYALERSPKWTPAIQNGKAVSEVHYLFYTIKNPARGPY